MEQKLGSTRLPGGTTIAYATAGSGPFLLFIGGWLSHLELSWALPAERHLFEGLARGRTIIRYEPTWLRPVRPAGPGECIVGV